MSTNVKNLKDKNDEFMNESSGRYSNPGWH